MPYTKDTKDPYFRRILISSSDVRTFHPDLIRGVVDYEVQLQKHWLFALHHCTKDALRALRIWQPNGVLHITPADSGLLNASQRHNVPVVEFGFSIPPISTSSSVLANNMAAGCMAAEHLLERGFRRFGYCGGKQSIYELRRDGFLQRIREAGGTCRVLEMPDFPPDRFSDMKRIHTLSRWLESFQFPVGILLATDGYASRLVEACQKRKLRIPDDLALIGVGNDDVLCRMTWPPLSSVELNLRRVGFEAAAMLDQLMDGRPAPTESPRFLPPSAVIARGSTETLAVEDEIVTAALRFIREFRPQLICVTEVVDHVHISRRSLEQRFQRYLGRSPAAEIRRVRMERSQKLLRETDLKIITVAEQCGYSNPTEFWKCFRRMIGSTPQEYRHQYRQNRMELKS